MRSVLIDYGHSGPGGILGIGEEASAQQTRLERGQILRAHMTLVHVIMFAVVRSSRKLDRVDRAVTLHREHAGHTGRLHARQA
jgi:hypothetical protein